MILYRYYIIMVISTDKIGWPILYIVLRVFFRMQTQFPLPEYLQVLSMLYIIMCVSKVIVEAKILDLHK